MVELGEHTTYVDCKETDNGNTKHTAMCCISRLFNQLFLRQLYTLYRELFMRVDHSVSLGRARCGRRYFERKEDVSSAQNEFPSGI